MDEIQRLEQAIAALEAQRSDLGDSVVDAAQSSLRLRQDELLQDSAREERKQVTVLFSDIVGSTDLMGGTDPEDLREVLNRYLRRWADCIKDHGGVVEKFIGDAVMAVFGLTTAHEDDPQRAIAAALEMQSELDTLNNSFRQAYHLSLDMRIGIHTGTVVVSTLGERPGQDFVAVGEPVNLASRLQTAAPINGILISADTHRLVQGIFLTTRREPVVLNGFPDPVDIYEVHGLRHRSAHVPRGLDGVQIQMVGRSAEFERLKHVYHRVLLDPRTWFVTIAGDPGIGKTRLLTEFMHWLEVQQPSPALFSTGSFEQNASVPFWALRSLFSFWCGILDSDSIEIARKKFERCMLPYFEDAALLKTQFIGAMLGFDYSNTPSLIDAYQDLKALRERALQYLAEWFCSLADRVPLFILVDDAQWADSASLEAFHSMAQICPDIPLLVVVLGRQRLDEVHPEWKARMVGAKYAQLWMMIRPLTHQECLQIISQVVRWEDPELDPIGRAMLDSASGNPYYLEEILKMLLEENILMQDQLSQYWEVNRERVASWRIPNTLTSVIQARLDSLPPSERSTLQKASAIGQIFWDRLLQAMEESDSAYSPKVISSLENLRRRLMIVPQSRSTFEHAQEYHFNQSLLREVVYDTILKRQRINYHSKIAMWLSQVVEQRGRGDEFAALVAHHFTKSGDLSLAASWLLRAGRHAHRQGALVEARRFLDMAYALTPDDDLDLLWSVLLQRDQLLGDLADLPARKADDSALLAIADRQRNPERQALAYRQISGTYYYIGEMGLALEAIDQALKAADQANLPNLQAYIYAWKIPNLVAIGKTSQASSLVDKALTMAENLNDDFELARTLVNISTYYSLIGDLGKAAQTLERQVDISHSASYLSAEATGLNNLGYCLVRLGRFSEARQVLERAQAICQPIGLTRDLAYVRLNLGLVLYFIGELAASRRLLELAVNERREAEDIFGQACGLCYLGSALEKSGLLEQARQAHSQAMALFHQKGMLPYAYEAQAFLSRDLLRIGEPAQAGKTATEVWEYLRENGDSTMESPLEAFLACTQVFISVGLIDNAVQALQQARAVLLSRAEKISDPTLRKSFLENVPAHQEIQLLWRQFI
jgi:class 3 adenylate cyclase/tetratricopeptide (TPR) repeat protein